MLKKLESCLKEKLKGMDLAEVTDILIFGSAVKGKEFPKDTDICIVFRKKIINETIANLQARLKGLNTHISALSTDDFFRKTHPLAKTLLVEGISIFTGKPLIHNLGFSASTIYSYDLSTLKPSEKVRFVYLLKGRETEGMVKKMGGEWMADSCFTIPIQNDSEMLLILKKWQIPFKRKEALIH